MQEFSQKDITSLHPPVLAPDHIQVHRIEISGLTTTFKLLMSQFFKVNICSMMEIR